MSRRVRKRFITLVIALAIALFGAWQAAGQQARDASAPSTHDSYADKLNPTPEPEPQPDVKGAQTPEQSSALPPAPATVPPELSPASVRTGPYRVASVSDGDTIRVEIDGKKQTLRFIGVDTPEVSAPNKPVQCYARQASAFTKSLLNGSTVYLESDERTDDKDRYGRILRYVYMTDGRLVQAELLRNGYAFAYTRFPFSRSEEFVALQLEAQAGRQGLWRDCKPSVSANGAYSTQPAD